MPVNTRVAASTSLAGTRVGISGWTYGPWRGTFYPPGLKHKEELAFAARHFNSIEINGTFYAMQKPASFAKWHEQTPVDFVFAIKAPRFITHMRKLRNVEEGLANFFASGLLRLNEKLGPILWQLPPVLRFDPERVEAFLKQLPADTRTAAEMGRHASERMTGRSWVEVDQNRPMRHAMEVRHETFNSPEFIALLRRYNVAIVVADTAGKWPVIEDVTADFVYVRLHGDEEIYASGYTDAALDRWAEKINAWRSGTQVAGARLVCTQPPPSRRRRDVYVYFDNDMKVLSPPNAMTLARKLHASPLGH